jgi:hypothetical protein
MGISVAGDIAPDFPGTREDRVFAAPIWFKSP